MTDQEDPLKLSEREIQFCKFVGGLVLIVAALTTVVGALFGWSINSVGIGALYVVGAVLVILGITSRLPTTFSLSDKGFALGYVAGAKDTAQKAADKVTAAQTAAQAVPEEAATQEAVANAKNPSEAKEALATVIVPKIVDMLPTRPEQFLPKTAERMQQIAECTPRKS